MGQITGTKSLSISVSINSVSTLVTSPTYPISFPPDSFFFTFRVAPSFPLMPAARTPSLSMYWTRPLFTFPRTISAISMVLSSVTRSPFTNWGSPPESFTHLLISLPPPCTMIGLKPTSFNNATSLITLFFRWLSVMALPPYFTTIFFPLNSRI